MSDYLWEQLLDTFFSFLCRKTDFYFGSADTSAAEALVLKTFRKYKEISDKVNEEKIKEREEVERKARERREQKRREEEEKLKAAANSPPKPKIVELTDEEAERLEQKLANDKKQQSNGDVSAGDNEVINSLSLSLSHNSNSISHTV
jgi:hypothetical protein